MSRRTTIILFLLVFTISRLDLTFINNITSETGFVFTDSQKFEILNNIIQACLLGVIGILIYLMILSTINKCYISKLPTDTTYPEFIGITVDYLKQFSMSKISYIQSFILIGTLFTISLYVDNFLRNIYNV